MIHNNNKRHDRIMNMLARTAYEKSPEDSSKHAAAIVYKNELVTIAWNEFKTHPLQAKFTLDDSRTYLHAEINVIRKSLNHLSLLELSKSTLYVARIMKSGEWGMSCPCKACQQAIIAFDINKVIYTTNPNEYMKFGSD